MQISIKEPNKRVFSIKVQTATAPKRTRVQSTNSNCNADTAPCMSPKTNTKITKRVNSTNPPISTAKTQMCRRHSPTAWPNLVNQIWIFRKRATQTKCKIFSLKQRPPIQTKQTRTARKGHLRRSLWSKARLATNLKSSTMTSMTDLATTLMSLCWLRSPIVRTTSELLTTRAELHLQSLFLQTGITREIVKTPKWIKIHPTISAWKGQCSSTKFRLILWTMCWGRVQATMASIRLSCCSIVWLNELTRWPQGRRLCLEAISFIRTRAKTKFLLHLMVSNWEMMTANPS